MPSPKRQRELGVIQRLVDEPFKFQFVQAVRILVRWLGRNGVPYDKAFTHVLRFQNSLSLSFPPSEIEALLTAPDDETTLAGLLQAVQRQTSTRITLTPAFIGFLGANGTLPLYHSERIAARQAQDRDDSTRAFLDIFSSRMVALYCQAWGKYRVEHRFDTQALDGFLPLLKALSGVQDVTFPSRDPRPDMCCVTEDVAAYYAALLRTRPVSASTVSRVLTDYFGVPVELEQFVGAWDYLPENKRSRLGNAETKLGYGAMLGTRLWRHDVRVRLNIGPLDKEDLVRFLPMGDAVAALAKMLALFGAPLLQYEVRLILSRPCIQRVVLTSKRSAMQRLGWNTFLANDTRNVTTAQVRYMLHP